VAKEGAVVVVPYTELNDCGTIFVHVATLSESGRMSGEALFFAAHSCHASTPQRFLAFLFDDEDA
jgi:hypothetical protein